MLQDNFHARKTDIGVAAKQTNLQLVRIISNLGQREEGQGRAGSPREATLGACGS